MQYQETELCVMSAENSSMLFTLRNWPAKAVPMNQVIAVMTDILENDDNAENKTRQLY